jgi:hypothetical protein
MINRIPNPSMEPLVRRALAAQPLEGKPFYEVHLEIAVGNPVALQQMTLLFPTTEAQRLLELLKARPPIPAGQKPGRTR